MEEVLRAFAADLLRFLHVASPGDRFFEIEVVSTSGEWVAVFSRSDDVTDDRITVNLETPPDDFMRRVNYLQPPGAHLEYDMWKRFAENDKSILGCTKRQVYFIRGGYTPKAWTTETAYSQLTTVLGNLIAFTPPKLCEEWRNIHTTNVTWSGFEDLVRRTVNCLFDDAIGHARAQSRTETAPGEERRDVIAHNKADHGFWHDLKVKFRASEVLFEVKHKTVLDRDDLRQTYCYLKPSIGYWGFLVFCGPKEDNILAYNRTLYRNFNGERGILIVNDQDFVRMLEIKMRQADPTDYLRNLYSAFNQAV